MVLPEIEEEAEDPSGRRASKLSLTSLLLGNYYQIWFIYEVQHLIAVNLIFIQILSIIGTYGLNTICISFFGF